MEREARWRGSVGLLPAHGVDSLDELLVSSVAGLSGGLDKAAALPAAEDNCDPEDEEEDEGAESCAKAGPVKVEQLEAAARLLD